MNDRVFVSGGSGFVGSAVIENLRSRGHDVVALINRGKPPAATGVTVVRGDLFDNNALDQGLAGCTAVVHLVGIIKEKRSQGATFERIHFQGTQAIVDAAKRNGVKRFIHMSALGARPDAASHYHQTKYKAEQYLRDSGLDWTIFRPSLIHGPSGEFMRMEARWVRGESPPFFFMPYFGAGLFGRGGAGKLQPVYVNDVARAFVDALENPRTIGEVYLLGGSQQVTWPELHRMSAQAILGKTRPVGAVPAWYARLLTRIAPAFALPFNRDQVLMSQEDNTCDLTKFRNDFGWEPQPFAATLNSYANKL